MRQLEDDLASAIGGAELASAGRSAVDGPACGRDAASRGGAKYARAS